jgi:hypothetical protein
LLRNALRIAWGFTGVAGFGYGAYVAINPALTDAAKHTYLLIAYIGCGLAIALALVAVWVESVYEREHDKQLVKAINEYQSADGTTAPLVGDLSLTDLAGANPTTLASDKTTVAAKMFDAMPEEKSLRQQVFPLVKTARDVLKKYHGSLKANSFVSPEFTFAFSPYRRAVVDKIGKIENCNILRKESMLPITVNRMVMLLEDLEHAAMPLASDIPPADIEK